MPAAERHGVLSEIGAGLTVAVVGLPQCLAYALLAGLPPAYGLTTAVVAGLVAAALGRSAQVVTGPTNTTGLLVLGALAPALGANGLLPAEGLPLLASLTLLAGLLRLAVALVGGAQLVRFLPESVLVGFTAGAGILIGAMQLDEALGLPPARGAGLLGELAELAAHAGSVAVPAVAVTLATVAVVASGRRLWPRAPVALIAVIGGAAVARLAGLDGSSGLPLVGERAVLAGGWPPFALPDLDPALLQRLLVPASAIVLLGTLELVVTTRAEGARPDLRREIVAQGWANVAGAFSGCFPASASLGRSALLRLGTARTRLAAAAAALLTLPPLLAGGALLGSIPQASLAGVLLVIGSRMIDRGAIARLWRAAPETRLLLVTTFVSTLVLPLEWAILLGSGTGLVIHLAKTSAPRLLALVPAGDRLVPLAPGATAETLVIEVSGDLHYAAVPPFLSEAERLIPDGVRAVVLDLSHAHEIRFTALRAFEQIEQELAREGARLRLAGVDEETRALIERSESSLRFTPADPEPGRSVRRCLEALAAEPATV